MKYKIFIDQGHNPENPNAGAEGNGLREQDLVYTIGIMTARLLNDSGDYEAEVSRSAPDEILGTSNAESLRARTDKANNWGADFYISLHCNASVIASASGSEGYAYSKESKGYEMGLDILKGLNRATGLENRGMFVRPSLYVLRKTYMPAVLIELGFITNAGDAALLSNSPQLFASGVYEGITEYYGT